MFFIKKYRHRPIYKKFVNLKDATQNNQKIFRFKKLKWKNLLFKLKLKSKYKKRNCYYRFYNQNFYHVSKFSNYFSRNNKLNMLNKKGFHISQGFLGDRYLKNQLKKSIKKSNSLNNSINLKMFFNSFLERRLDSILVKSRFTLSKRNARQFINHGHVLVNEKIVKDSSFLLKSGDKITFNKKINNLIQYYILKSNNWPLPPENIQISYVNLQIRVIEDFTFSDRVNSNMYLNSIINFYKK